MEALGSVVTILEIVKVARAIQKKIRHIRMNPEIRGRLLKEADSLEKILTAAESMSDGAARELQRSLEDVTSRLESLAPGLRKRDRIFNIVSGCVTGEPEETKLEEVERELKSLRTQVVVVDQVLKLKKRIYSGPRELPQSAGDSLQNRATPILTFLQDSKSEELRVIGVHGMAGLGKTTLLDYIWQEASLTPPFCMRAHVQIGYDAVNPQRLCSLQSSILQQLGGGSVKFTSPAGGRMKLSDHFRKLRDEKKPVFLAIDNIFNADDLRNVLPSTVSAPNTSCIAATCRDFKVLEALVDICSLDQENHSRVLCFNPPCLDPEESREVFAKYGGLLMDRDAELLDNLVPLCKGLPLALKVLGKIFTKKANREREGWERIKEEMEDVHADETPTMAAVTKSLRLSYEQLGKQRQAAFLDVVTFFYGWRWEKVERIVGVSVLGDLRDSSLVTKADGWSKCNQHALRTGYNTDHMYYGFDDLLDQTVVAMHDLTLQFGEHLCSLSVTTMTDVESVEGFLRGLEAPPKSIRNLLLRSPHAHLGDADAEVEFLEKTRSLQMLQLWATNSDSINFVDLGKKLFKANYYAGLDVEGPRPQGLRYLSLVDWKSSRRIMEMKVSREIREIHLYGCRDVEQLPDHAPLHQLECLCIKKCAQFQGFSSACVENWHKLKLLDVSFCELSMSIPAELGHLESLMAVRFGYCSGLETFPSLCNVKGPSRLEIAKCRCLRALATISCPLQTLVLESLSISSLTLEATALVHLQFICLRSCQFEVLPISICNALSLRCLEVRECGSLVELPDEVGRLTSLTDLHISSCKKLRALPPAIQNLSLQRLSLAGWENVEELPDELGSLTSLTALTISGCKILKALPPAIGKLSCLQTLDLHGWESLEELSDEVGSLTSLTELDVSCCKVLKALPPAIGKLSSLQRLNLGECESLEELPGEVRRLTSLTILCLSGCSNLKALPPAIGKLLSLQRLILNGCKSLEDLPDDVERLTSLTNLYLSNCCSNSKALPPAIGNLPSLQTLSLGSWKSLEELSDEVGRLILLTELEMDGCKILKALPPAIGELSFLQRFSLNGCESLEKLPDEVEKLTSLTELDMSLCKVLKALPPAIGKLSSLQRLILRECESLEELPDEVGRLMSLTKLDLSGCKNLKALSPAIRKLSSIQNLDLRGCESLEKLPDEVGRLTSVRHMCLFSCKNLRALPPAIGKLSLLRSLYLAGCESLEELPDAVGKLTMLRHLDVSGCKNLKALPPAIGKLSSLESLWLARCESLEDLPNEVEMLTSLTEVDLSGCKNLKALPPAIGKLSSLQGLKLEGCKSLEELPDEVGRLMSLTKLDLSGCKNLKALPPAIGKLSSLQDLDLGGCESLEELPNEVEMLTSLREVDISGCKNLKGLPPAIQNKSESNSESEPEGAA